MDDYTIKNEERVEVARKTLDRYCFVKGCDPSLDNQESNITDLLTDLWHLCDDEKLDFHRLLASAQMHHEAEIEEKEIET